MSRYSRRRKYCRFTAEGIKEIDYKDLNLLKAYVTETGKIVGEFGSYGNADCKGKGSKYPHPELPFGSISSLAVWKDKLFVMDVLNRRLVKCNIVYDSALKSAK